MMYQFCDFDLISRIIVSEPYLAYSLREESQIQGCGNTMPDLSDQVPFHSGQMEIFYLLVLGQVQCIKLIQIYSSYFDHYEITSCIENNVDPDQLASSREAS